MTAPDSPDPSGKKKKASKRKAAKKKAQPKETPSPFDLPDASAEADEDGGSEVEAGRYTIIGGDGQEYGPRPIGDMRRWIRTGRADAGTLVRVDPGTDWNPLGEVPELAALLTEEVPLPKRPVKVWAIAILTLLGGVVSGTWPWMLQSMDLGYFWCCLFPSVPFSLISGIVITVLGARLLVARPESALPGAGTAATLMICGIIACNPASLLLGILCHGLLGHREVVDYQQAILRGPIRPR